MWEDFENEKVSGAALLVVSRIARFGHGAGVGRCVWGILLPEGEHRERSQPRRMECVAGRKSYRSDRGCGGFRREPRNTRATRLWSGWQHGYKHPYLPLRAAALWTHLRKCFAFRPRSL